MSNDFKSFLKGLLIKDPSKRLTWPELAVRKQPLCIILVQHEAKGASKRLASSPSDVGTWLQTPRRKPLRGPCRSQPHQRARAMKLCAHPLLSSSPPSLAWVSSDAAMRPPSLAWVSSDAAMRPPLMLGNAHMSQCRSIHSS
jgi:hypothetical protein